MNLFTLGYDLGLHLYALASLPKIALHYKKYKHSFWQKLGKGFPSIDKQGRPLIWVHAVSLGETKAVAPLIRKFKNQKNAPLILLSTSTETGHQEGVKNIPEADYHVFLPFDFSYLIRPIVKKAAPNLVILTETDFWYHFQEGAKLSGAKIALINGKLSERSFSRLKKIPFLARRLLSSIDHFLVQGELYRDRFANLNITQSQLTVTGNIKFDSPIEGADTQLLKEELALSDQPVVTLGSTHDPEEKIFLSVLKKIWEHFPHLKICLVPRHPERFDQVAKLLENAKIPYARWSEKGNFTKASVLLVDAMGVLRKCYQISHFAFVGGSLTPKVGGHNILEPAFFGKAVLFGPHMHAQPDLLDQVLAYQAGVQVTEETLFDTLFHLLSKPAYTQQLGKNGQNLILSSRGALELTFKTLLPLLQKQSS